MCTRMFSWLCLVSAAAWAQPTAELASDAGTGAVSNPAAAAPAVASSAATDAGVTLSVMPAPTEPARVAEPVKAPPPPRDPPKKIEPAPQPVAEPEKPSKPFIEIDWEGLLPPSTPLERQVYELSAVYSMRNFGFAEGPMTLSGVRVNERNGGVGKMMVYIITQLALALGEAAAASSGKYVGTTYHPGYHIDYYRSYTPSEMAGMRQAREKAGDDVLSSNFSLDISYFWPLQGYSKGAGFSIEITPLTIAFDDAQEWGMEIAGVWTRFGDTNVGTVTPGGPTTAPTDRQYNNLGIPIRFMHSGRWVQVTLQWTPNFFGGFGFSPKVMEANYINSLSTKTIAYNNSPLMLSVAFTPIRHVFVRATGYWEKFVFSTNVLSYQLEAGLRF